MNSQKKIDKIVDLMRLDDSFDAPPETMKWAKNLIRSRAVEPKRTLLQRVVAVLQMDLSPQDAVFGERSAAVSDARQLFFQAGENGIDLRVSKDSKGLKIQGQILGSGFEQSSITISGDNISFATVTGNAADFQVGNVPSGSYRLIAEGKESEVIIEHLEL